MLRVDLERIERNFVRAISAIIVLFCFACSADALTVRAAISQDGSFDTGYRAGNKPIDPGATCPTGWTCATKGTGGGEIDEISSTSFEIVASGADDEGDILYAYQSCGSGDCEVIARVPDASAWVGHIETFTGFLVGISDGTGDNDFYCQAWTTPDGRVRCKCGTPGPDDFNSISVAGVLPEFIAVARDASANEYRCLQSEDGITYSTLGTFTRVYAGASIGYVGGTSHDTTATTAVTLTDIDRDTTIDTYTPDPPPDPDPPNDPPTWTAIPNQNWTQGQPVSLDISGNCTDPNADPVSFSGSGFPSGISVSNAGLISGTPTATGLFNPIVTCADDTDGEADETFQATVTSSSGDTIDWTTGMANSRTCAQLGAGPGDTVVIHGSGGGNTRSNLVIENCHGTETSPIMFKNDVTASGPLDFNGSTTWGIELRSSTHIVIDGSGKWSGATAELCGVDPNESNRMLAPTGARQCGIVLSGSFQSGIKRKGYVSHVRITGVEIDGTGGIRSGIAANDHGYTLSGVTQLQCQNNPNLNGCEWQEGWVMTNLYCHDTFSECFYIGANANTSTIDDLPLRCNEISWVYVKDSGWDALSMKSVITDDMGDGTTCLSSMHNNYVDGAGLSGNPPADGNSGACADFFEGGFGNVYNNVFKNCRGHGFLINFQNRPSTYGVMPINIFNNVIWNAGVSAEHGDNGINIGRKNTSVAEAQPNIYNNTIVEPRGIAINVTNLSDPCTVRDNLAAGSTTGKRNISASHCTAVAQNTKTAITDFVNAGTGDFHLTSGNAACNAASTNAPPTDFEGDPRPLDGADDRGADEAAACPN